MLLSDVSIKRPVFATMLNLVLVVFGLFSLPRLGIDQYPNVDFPVVTVSVVYPGADPESVEQRILKPIEEAVNGIALLDKLSSTAYPNLGQVILQFKLEKEGDKAAQEVRDKVFAAVRNLPDEAETPVVQKFDIGGAPIVNVGIRGDGINYGDLSAFAKDIIQPALQRVDGVANVNTAGIREREVQIFVDREKLASFGLTPSDVINSVTQQNLDVPSGKVENAESYWTVRVKGRLANGNEVAQLPIIAAGNTKLRISDVATVKDEIAEEKTAAYLGDTPAILMSIQKQAGGSTTAVADGARAAIKKLQAAAPKGVTIEVVTDNSKYIKGSIDSVKLDLVLGAVLATFIVMLFLRNFWITVISAVALPTAVIATFAFIDFKGFTLNTMSTLGLSLSIGILIDDAIIVIENIARHLGMGKSGPKAAKDAMDEIGLAVLATTGTICAVFVPVAFMEGIVGRFFYQFGLTVAFAVAISLFVAFTLTPMMASRLLKGDGHSHEPKNPLLRGPYVAIERFLTSLDHLYKSILGWALRTEPVVMKGLERSSRKKGTIFGRMVAWFLRAFFSPRSLTLFMGVAALVVSVIMLRFVPVAFFPKEDRSQFNIAYTLPEGTTLEATKKKSLELSEEIRKYPGVKFVVTAVAATQDAKPNKSRLDIILVDKEERSYSQEQIMARLREDLGPKYAVNGSEMLVQEESGGGGGRSQPIQLIFKSDDWQTLTSYTDEMSDWVAKNVQGTVDVSTTKPKVQRELRIEIDPARAADLGVSAGQIGQTLRALYEGDKIGEIQDKGTTYDVRMRISDAGRLKAEDLAGVTLTSRTGQRLTLGSIAKIRESEAPSAIERYDGQRQIVVLANFTGKDLNAAANQIQQHVTATMPPQLTLALAGQTEIMKDSIAAMLKALAIAVLLVYMILCAQYERYLAPLVIMTALPLSFTGAFGSLLVTGQIMSIFTMIGIILLMGIVTKNGILLIDFTMQRMAEGKSVSEALLEAGPIRLRPILMTTFAAGGGMLPIAIGHGVGGESRSPLGVAVIGGLLMSTVLTLVVVPCLFSAVEGLRGKKARGAERDEDDADSGDGRREESDVATWKVSKGTGAALQAKH
jgi:HAE1 family hydrophobic/amphiphilic exporter-1